MQLCSSIGKSAKPGSRIICLSSIRLSTSWRAFIDALATRLLRRAIARQELRRVAAKRWRLAITVCGIEHVERWIAGMRIILIDQRRIEAG